MFYKWTDALATDQATSRANPLRRKRHMYLPARECSVCGENERWHRQQYIPAADACLIDLSSPTGITEEGWDIFASRFREQNHIDANYRLYPGASIGIPEYELSSTKVNDVMWPFQEIVVTRRLFDIMMDAGLTGFNAVAPHLTWNRRLRDRGLPPPHLVTLDIAGRGWRTGTKAELACPHCRRMRLEMAGGDIDPERWDGSDVFYIDSTNIAIGVTERVRQVLTAHRITNFRLIPVEEMSYLKKTLADIASGTHRFHPGVPLGY